MKWFNESMTPDEARIQFFFSNISGKTDEEKAEIRRELESVSSKIVRRELSDSRLMFTENR